MPSTIGWLAVAIATGSLAGRMIGHWPVVSGWLRRCLEDPAVGAGDAGRATPSDERLRRRS